MDRAGGVEPEQVARNVDRYMASFRAQRKWVVKVALVGLWLYPLRFLDPPFPKMDPERRRRFLERRFIGDIAFRRIRIGRRLVQAMFRLSQQMAYLGYYGDKRTFASVGYAPFSERERYAEATRSVQPERPRVTCLSSAEVGEEISADAVVVGSGAAGAVTEDEVVQISNLCGTIALDRGGLWWCRAFAVRASEGRGDRRHRIAL